MAELQLIPNQVVEAKITSILATKLDMRGLFTVDTSLTTASGLSKRIYKSTYSGKVEKLLKGQKSSADAYGSVTLTHSDYEIARYQTAYKYNDMDYMADATIVDRLSNGAAETITNQLRAEYFAELAKISNTFQGTGSVYEAVVDAVASLKNAAEEDTNGLFIIMGADLRAAVRKDALFEASKQGEILYTGQFGTIAGIPCVYSNSVPEKTVYLTEKPAVTLFVKQEGQVETERDVDSKDNSVFYTRYGVVALTDDTRSCIITMQA